MLWSVSNHKSNCNALNKQYSSEVAVFNMVLYFTGFLWLQGASSWLPIMSRIIEMLSAVLRDLGQPLPDFCSVEPQLSIFFSQTIHTCHRPSLVRKLFIRHLAPIFSLLVDPLSNSGRPSLFCPFKPSKTIKTENIANKNYDVIMSS